MIPCFVHPEVIFWPVFIIATLATVVGSQAVISATFSIISQCRALSCFPRVRIIHTSNQIHGQIYIPEVNWILMFLCLAVVIGFRDTDMIGNAYGTYFHLCLCFPTSPYRHPQQFRNLIIWVFSLSSISILFPFFVKLAFWHVCHFLPGLAVIIVMLITTCLMFLVIVMVWKRTILVAITFVIIFGSIELLYFSACITKVHKGGWVPIVLSLIVLFFMSIWHYGTLKKRSFELQNKVCLDTLLTLGPSLGINRVRGICLIYSNVVSGVPPMFAHFVTNFPAFHEILVFVTIQSLTVPKVPAEEQVLVSRIGSPEYRLFRCIVRYGYRDVRKDAYAFEGHVLNSVAEFLKGNSDGCVESGAYGGEMTVIRQPSSQLVDAVIRQPENGAVTGTSRRKVRFSTVGLNKEVEELEAAREAGLAYMMGNTCVMASETSSYLKKFVIDIVYGFLRQNCRRPATSLGVPHTSLIEVGMVYRV